MDSFIHRLSAYANGVTDEVLSEIMDHAAASQQTYGDFTSTHEALGVALEEWQELITAIHHNAIESVRDEAIDLASVLIRLAAQCRSSEAMKRRSMPAK